MINSSLYRKPQRLDSNLHRNKKLKPMQDYSITAGMHAVYLLAAEFPQAALEFPVIFVKSGELRPDGTSMISPVALLGLSARENLWLDGKRWTGRYLPAFVRRFPYLTAGLPGKKRPGVFIDTGWEGFNDAEGTPLFQPDGAPTPELEKAMVFLQSFDIEQQRTRAVCTSIIDLDLLKSMEADARLPSGESLKVEGFLVIDEEKLLALPEATVMELHRNGMLMLLHAQMMSMNNLPHLLERKAMRAAVAGSARV